MTRAASTTVTVVIAARDAEATLGAALRSALAEPLVVQCVVVDDASTDATGSTAASIARADPRVQVVRRQARGGPSVARNDGLARAGAPGSASSTPTTRSWPPASRPSPRRCPARHWRSSPSGGSARSTTPVRPWTSAAGPPSSCSAWCAATAGSSRAPTGSRPRRSSRGSCRRPRGRGSWTPRRRVRSGGSTRGCAAARTSSCSSASRPRAPSCPSSATCLSYRRHDRAAQRRDGSPAMGQGARAVGDAARRARRARDAAGSSRGMVAYHLELFAARVARPDAGACARWRCATSRVAGAVARRRARRGRAPDGGCPRRSTSVAVD